MKPETGQRRYCAHRGVCTPAAFGNGVFPAAVSAAFNALRSAVLIARHAVTDFERSTDSSSRHHSWNRSQSSLGVVPAWCPPA